MLKHQTGRSPSVGKAITQGTFTAIAIAFLFTAILAKLVDLEAIKMEQVGYGILIAHIASVFLGTKTAMGGVGKETLMAAGITGALYYLILLMINSFFFGGELAGLGTTLILVIAGIALSILTDRKQTQGRHRKRYKIPR